MTEPLETPIRHRHQHTGANHETHPTETHIETNQRHDNQPKQPNTKRNNTNHLPAMQNQLSPEAQPWTPHERWQSKRYKPDELTALVEEASQRFCTSQTWQEYVDRSRDASDFHPNTRQLPHPAAHLLDHLRKRGAPVCLSTSP